MTDRVVPAYFGGLDTSVGIGWIAGETGAGMTAVAVDVGQDGRVQLWGLSSRIAAGRAERVKGGGK